MLTPLGDLSQARELGDQVLNRRRRLLGENHPDTLTWAKKLVADLRELGDGLLSAASGPGDILRPTSDERRAQPSLALEGSRPAIARRPEPRRNGNTLFLS